jgi:predicted branched-subunit amino acid permease
MLSGRNGGKGEREQYFEGVTVVSLVMWIEPCAVGGMVGGGN